MSEIEACHQVFVYGTLRRTGSNHWRMAGANFVGETTVEGRLYRVDWYPGLVLEVGTGEVSGEVFQLSSEEQLQALDHYEGPEYQRVMHDTAHGPAWVWEFIRSTEGLERIDSGVWDYTNSQK